MARDAADPAAARKGMSGLGSQIWIAGLAGLMTLMLALQIWAGFGVISSTRAVADGDALMRETDSLLHLLQETEVTQGRYLRLQTADVDVLLHVGLRLLGHMVKKSRDGVNGGSYVVKEF